MIPYQTKAGKLPGTDDQEVFKQAQEIYKRIKMLEIEKGKNPTVKILQVRSRIGRKVTQ